MLPASEEDGNVHSKNADEDADADDDNADVSSHDFIQLMPTTT